MFRKFFKFIMVFTFVLGFIALCTGTAVGLYFYHRYTRDLPQIENLKDYQPKAVTSIYANDGTVIAEAYDEPCRRYPVNIKDIPLVIRHAFLAAEDADFYNHPGIDFVSILRAAYKNVVHGKVRQGASTITQQTVKSLLLTREKSIERKVKEAILSYRLERYLSKDEIFSIYLNEIFLGSAACGVKAAAKMHFHKKLEDITIAEAAFLAALPQRPSELTSPKNRTAALMRQRYVIEQMLKKKMITQAEFDEAERYKLKIYHYDEQTIFAAPYYSSNIINTVLPSILQKIDRYSSAGNPGGFQVYTSVDLKATDMATRALQKGLREVDKRQGWRGPLIIDGTTKNEVEVKVLSENDVKPDQIYKAKVTKIGPESGMFTVQVGALEGVLNIKSATWAKRFVKNSEVRGVEPGSLIKLGDLIEVSLDEPKENDKQTKKNNSLFSFKLDQTPELESAFMLADAFSGEVKAMIGGYDFQRSKFNRVTSALRQPGSSFKPFVYASAIESLNYTPVTIVPDSPISLIAGNGELWTPGNFDGKYLGPITLRTALQRSRNVVSVYLIQKLGLERVIEMARRFGITTDLQPNLSIALGSSEVYMFELVRAYGAFATGGLLADPLFIKEIKDRHGKTIYQQLPHARRVMKEDDAFIMANMMKGVVERGTATILKSLEKPMAGKTGTTNDQMDAWFIGYTPEWVGGVWSGYDLKRTIGKMETGGKVSAPIMLYFMQEFLANTLPLDFIVPDNVVPVPIDLESGHVVSANNPGAFIEYFKSGTEPKPYTEPSHEENVSDDQSENLVSPVEEKPRGEAVD